MLKRKPKYIEVMATADSSVVQFHGKEKSEKYVLTLMNIVSSKAYVVCLADYLVSDDFTYGYNLFSAFSLQVSRIFQHKSIGVPIYFVVVKLVLLEKDPVRRIYENENTNTRGRVLLDQLQEIFVPYLTIRLRARGLHNAQKVRENVQIVLV